MLRILIAAALAGTCGGVLAQPLYKCSVDGTVTYSSEKCKGKTLGEILPPEPRKLKPGLAAADLERDRTLANAKEADRDALRQDAQSKGDLLSSECPG